MNMMTKKKIEKSQPCFFFFLADPAPFALQKVCLLVSVGCHLLSWMSTITGSGSGESRALPSNQASHLSHTQLITLNY